MRVRRLNTFAVVLSLLAPVAAPAGNPCIGDARQQFVEAQAQCREDLQVARDGCLNRDHECVEVCRANRSVCVDESGIETALDACNDATRAAKATCRAQNPPESPALDQCIDQAQVVGFQCRDVAREAARPALDACRVAFRGCARVSSAEPAERGRGPRPVPPRREGGPQGVQDDRARGAPVPERRVQEPRSRVRGAVSHGPRRLPRAGGEPARGEHRSVPSPA